MNAPTTPIRIRKVGHVVYEVSDLERTTAFWTEVMGFTVSDRNELGMVFLNGCGDHHTIALVPGTGKAKPGKDALQIHHWAMEVDRVDDLFAARAFLRERGIPVTFEGRRGPGANVSLEFKDPDGYTLELYCEMERIAPGGNARPASEWKRSRSLEEAAR